MKNIIRPQVEHFDGFSIVVKKGNRNEFRPVTGKDNLPVNMENVFTFYSGISTDQNEIPYPIIGFDDTTSRISTWFYPPTPEGTNQRDADLKFLYDNFTTKCPPAIDSKIKMTFK